MRNLLRALVLIPLAASLSFAGSPYKGVLDLGNTNPAAIAMRELHDGMWLVGAQTQLWHLQNNATGNEVFHVSGFWVTRLEGQDTAYGPSIGINIHEAGLAAINKLEILVPAIEQMGQVLPPFVSKLTAATSLEVLGGYRPTIGADDHHWIYGFGAKVTIPMDTLYAWAKGVSGQKGL